MQNLFGVFMRTAFLLLILLASCTGGLDQPRSGTTTCAADADCVGNQICGDFGRCVDPGTDTSALQFTGSTTLNRDLVRAGETVEMRFSLNRPAIFDPVVTLQGAGEILQLAQAAFDDATNEYRYIYTVNGTESEVEYRGRVVISDVFDTEIEALSAGTVSFDFTAPDIVTGTEQIALIPAADNPQQTVTSATAGTVIRALVQVDEAVSTSTLELSGTPETFTEASSFGAVLTYELTLGSSVAGGQYNLELTLSDLAGNSNTVAFGTVEVDQQPPAAPDVDTDRQIVYRQEPWGSDTNSDAYAEVRGDVGAVESDSLVRVFGDASGSTLLGSTNADLDGRFRIPLLIPNRDVVYIEAIDGAGNRSPLRQVRDGEWVATLNGADETPGNPNPHSASEIRFNTSSRRFNDPNADRLDDARLEALWSANDEAARVDFAGAWSRVVTEKDGIPVGNLAAAYDRIRQETIVFGGTPDVFFGSVLQNTYRYSNGELNVVNPVGRQPSGRAGHTMVYDTRSGVLLFGGLASSGGTVADTWTWAGDGWVELTPDESPPPRFLHGMAHDAVRGVTVVYGGCADVACQTLYEDVWEWDGIAWTEVTQSGTRPSTRAAHAMAPHSGGVVVQGGCTGGFQTGLGLECESVDAGLLDQGATSPTYLWDGSTWTIMPGARAEERMFHQLLSINGELLMVGGCYYEETGDGDACFNREETWCRPDDGGWFEISDNNDEAESGVSVYHEVDNEIVSFGGFNRQTFTFDSTPQVQRRILGWEGSCEDGTWLDTTSANPGTSQNDDLIYDRVSNRVAVYTFDAHLYDPYLQSWRRTASSTDPGFAYAYRFVYDYEINRGYLVGGDTGAGSVFTTFRYDPTSTFGSWQEVCTTTFCRNGLGRRLFPASTFDFEGGQVLIYGGVTNYSSSTVETGLWGYNGVQWVPRCTTCNPRPSTGYCAAMAYDEARDVSLLFGGSSQNNQSECREAGFDIPAQAKPSTLWQWNGSAWSRICGSGSGTNCSGPSGRIGHVLTYHPGFARTFLLGGGDDEVWQWDGQSWSIFEVVGPRPANRFAPGATATEFDGPLYLYGGRIGEDWVDDFWRLDLNGRPSVRVEFDWLSAGLAKEQIRSIALRVISGGRGYSLDSSLGSDRDTYGDPLSGVSIRVFSTSTGGFPGAANASTGADTDSPTQVVLESLSTDEKDDWLVDVTGTVSLDISSTATSGNGPEPGSVALDYVEMVLRYRR